MPDKLTPEQRRKCMSSIRGKDTKPEILVRKGLHARGFRFRLQERRLPGRPDMTLPRYGVAVMVNGCFWHGHQGCRYATRPKSNTEFWTEKIARNRHRDQVTEAHLEALGWKVITVWECELGEPGLRRQGWMPWLRRSGGRERSTSRPAAEGGSAGWRAGLSVSACWRGRRDLRRNCMTGIMSPEAYRNSQKRNNHPGTLFDLASGG